MGGDQAGDPWFRYLSDRADRAIDDFLSEEMEDIYKGLTPLAKQTIYFLQLLNRRDSIKDKSKIWDNGVDGFVKFGGEEFIEKMRKEAEEKGRRKEEKEKEGGLADEFSGGNVDVNCGDGNGGNGGNGGNDVGDGDQAGDPWFRYLSDRADRAID